MKDASLTAARHYARALLDVALKSGSAETVRGEIRSALELLKGHEDLESALTHPAVPATKKRRIVEEVWTQKTSSPLFSRFLALLAEHDRVGLLGAIEQSFTVQWNETRHVVLADIVSAVALDEQQARAVAKTVEGAIGRTVEMRTTVDPALLGGVVVRVGGLSFDGSVRARLAALRNRLAGV